MGPMAPALRYLPAGGVARTAERTIVKRIPRGLVAIAAIAPSALVGCDVGSLVSEPPSAICAEAGVQCRLPAGPLGVCERSPCPSGADPPCFRCVPQH
jgi:hypothetical protein